MHPKIDYNSKTYYQVGCKKCQKAEFWTIYYNEEQFIAKCKCGNTIRIEAKSIQRKPDG